MGVIIVQIFLTVAAMNSTKRQSYRIASLLAVGYIGYEFLQPVLPKGVFDWKDVYGTLVGLCFAFAVLWIIWRRYIEETEERDGGEQGGRVSV